ncbi:MAG TPA: sodium:solute symporter family protein [Gammaproteobacteria bacterium]|nr:sodium:solute symporter family protein [Gammaproteobacteria bacterium]
MNQTHFLLLLLGIGFTYLIIGLYAGRKIIDKADYFLASRSYGVFAVTLTLVATQLGGGMILGTSNEAYHVGIYGIAYSAGIFLGFIALALGLAHKLRGFNVATTAELFETKYHSTFLRKIAAVMMILSLCGILAGQVVASRMFLHGLGIHHEGIFLLFWGFVIGYTVMGGLKAVVLTDIYQVLFIFVLFIGLFFWAQTDYPVTSLDWSPAPGAFTQEINWQTFTPMLLLPFLFCLIEQDLAQRFFSARTQRVATGAAIGAACLILIFACIPAYFGLLTKELGIEIPPHTSVLIALMRTLVPDVVLALIACGLLAAIVSTADSLLCAISSNLAQDFGTLSKNPRREVHISRLITLIGGVIAILIAYYMDNILEVLVKSYELPVTCLFASIFFCCILKRVYTLAAVLSVFAGLGTFIVFKIFPISFPNEIIQILCSFLGYGIGWVIAKRSPTLA